MRMRSGNKTLQHGLTMMLIRFHSKAGSLTMLGDNANTVLRLMGATGDVPGALVAKDLPRAIENLKRGLAVQTKNQPPEPSTDGGDSEDRDQVALSARGYPLVQLLEATLKSNSDVIWEEASKSTG
jgi:hypothetical protein